MRRGNHLPRLGIFSTVAMLVLSMNTSGASAASSSHKWSVPVFIGTRGSSSTQVKYSISCPSTTFCAAVDGNGQVHFRRSGVWSSPQTLAVGGSIDTISCSSKSFCVAIGSGNAALFNGRVWSTEVLIGPAGDTYQVSCPTSTFCAAIGANGIPGKKSALLTFNGHSWTTYKTSSTGGLKDRLLGVSCATTRFCMAANFDGEILGFNGSGWSPGHVSGPGGLISVSCPTSRFCMVVTDTGVSMKYQNGKWSAPETITSFTSAGPYSVSCVSSTWCSVMGLSGSAVTWIAGRWSTPSTVFSGGYQAGVAISCSAADNCVAVSDRGMSASQ